MQVFSCEYCEILKNTYFEEHLPTATFLHGAIARDFETCDFKKLYYDPRIIYKKTDEWYIE